MDARLATQVTGNQPHQRLSHNQADRLLLVPAQQRTERRLDPSHRTFDGLAQRGTDRRGIVDPLSEQLGVSPLDFVDLEPLPQPLVEVAEFVDPLGPDPRILPTISAVRMTFSPGPQ